MPKLYYPTPDELQGATPLNELVWFDKYQHTLLRLVNTNEGRDLLCLDNHPYPIVMLRKNVAKYYLGKWDGRYHFLSDFRIGAKWGNAIRFRWREVQRALDRMLLEELLALPPLILPDGKVLRPIAGATTLIAYPEPHEESTTVDGNYGRVVAEQTFLQIRGGVGTYANDTTPSNACPSVSTDANTNEYDFMQAACFLYDTSSIGSDNIDSAICSIVGEGTTLDNFSQTINLTTCDLASATAVVASDYQNRTHEQQCDTPISAASWSVGSRNSYTANSTGIASIDTGGVTYYGLEILADFSDTAPSFAANTTGGVNCYFADQSSTSNDPKLVVEHTSAFVPKLMMF